MLVSKALVSASYQYFNNMLSRLPSTTNQQAKELPKRVTQPRFHDSTLMGFLQLDR